MNDERKRIARQYVHDMVRSFVKGDTERPGGALTMTSIYAPDIERLLEIACYSDNYAKKHKALNPFCVSNYYDIDGHCVHSLKGTVTIIFNGVSIQQKEYAGRSPSGGAHAERLESVAKYKEGDAVPPGLRSSPPRPGEAREARQREDEPHPK